MVRLGLGDDRPKADFVCDSEDVIESIDSDPPKKIVILPIALKPRVDLDFEAAGKGLNRRLGMLHVIPGLQLGETELLDGQFLIRVPLAFRDGNRLENGVEEIFLREMVVDLE